MALYFIFCDMIYDIVPYYVILNYAWYIIYLILYIIIIIILYSYIDLWYTALKCQVCLALKIYLYHAALRMTDWSKYILRGGLVEVTAVSPHAVHKISNF